MYLRGNACSAGETLNFPPSLESMTVPPPCHHQSLGLARVAQVATIPTHFDGAQGVRWLWLTCSSRLGLKRNQIQTNVWKKGVVLLLLLLLEKEVQTNIFYLSFCGETCNYFSVLNKSIFGPIFEAAPMYSNMASAVPLSFRVLAAFKDDAAANELLESISRADAAGDHGHVT